MQTPAEQKGSVAGMLNTIVTVMPVIAARSEHGFDITQALAATVSDVVLTVRTITRCADAVPVKKAK